MALLRRTRRKGLVLLAIICLSSSTLLRICIQGERIYRQYGGGLTAKPDTVINDGAIPPDRITVRHVLNVSQPVTNRIESRHKCDKSPHCSHLLSLHETIAYKQCTRSAYKKGPLYDDLFAPCRFLNSSNRRPIALASFPGSGNTWARGLLQLATGICTGSVYCDRDLRRHGFTGEGLDTGSVLVTKTHRPNSKTYKRNRVPAATLNFAKVILIVRNPFDAIISERNRQVGSVNNNSNSNNNETKRKEGRHIATARKDKFGHNQQWNQFINAKIKWWTNMIRYWLIQWTSGPVLVISYEDLKHDTNRQVKKMLNFINYTQISENELTLRLKNGFNTYHRKHQKQGNDSNNIYNTYYTPTQIRTINQYILTAHTEITKLNKSFNISLISYIQS